VAGVVIVQPGGDPNGDFIVRIRGATSLEGQPPLLVIDGVAIDDFNKAITTLNPADVESFDILKDASAAAIYGARGGNGVMLITTKSSRLGKASVDYNSFVGLEKVSNQLNVLSADEWRNTTNPIGGGGLDKGADMDWQKETSRTGISHSHTIGISGGSSQFSFRGSIGYTRQEGIIINSGKEIITARITANQQSFDNKLEIRYGITTAVIQRDFMPDQTSTSQVRTQGSNFFALALEHLRFYRLITPMDPTSRLPIPV
jgi:iron complex outermembrane receptor protein